MTTQNIPLFKALAEKMNFLDQRQSVLARNIANADTPNYKPHDLVEMDFGTILGHVSRGSGDIRMATTSAGHMPAPNELPEAQDRRQKKTYEVAPAGNAVIMEEQMVKAARTTMDYNLMTNLYRKNVGLIRTALGRGG